MKIEESSYEGGGKSTAAEAQDVKRFPPFAICAAPIDRRRLVAGAPKSARLPANNPIIRLF
jgi:hypothetical protein